MKPTLQHGSMKMKEAHESLGEVGISPEAEQKALCYLQAAEGRLIPKGGAFHGLYGGAVYAKRTFNSLQSVQSGIEQTVKALNEAAVNADALNENLASAHTNSTLGCEAIASYAKGAGIPVANPYE